MRVVGVVAGAAFEDSSFDLQLSFLLIQHSPLHWVLDVVASVSGVVLELALWQHLVASNRGHFLPHCDAFVIVGRCVA